MTASLPTLVSGVGLGCAQLGNLYRAITDEQAQAIVDAAWDSGIRYFDVAPHYGIGLAERRLGDALRSRPRDEYVLSTKVGRLLEANPSFGGERDDDLFEVPATYKRRLDYSRDGALRSLEGSLERLGLDRIDIAYVHDPDEHLNEALEGAFPALDELRREGVLRGYGAGMNQSAALADFIRYTDANIMMLAGRYTLLDQSADDDLLPLAQEHRVEIVAAGVFNSGILAENTPPQKPRYDYGDASPAIVERAWAISRICNDHSVSLRSAAAHFPFTAPAVSAVVPGAGSPVQARENAALLNEKVPKALWRDLHAAGLVRRDLRLEAS